MEREAFCELRLEGGLEEGIFRAGSDQRAVKVRGRGGVSMADEVISDGDGNCWKY